MRFDTVISNGTVVTATDTYAGDVGIQDGKIAAIAGTLPIENAAKVIDNGTTSCASTSQVGTVKITDSSVTSHTVILGQGTGGSAGGGELERLAGGARAAEARCATAARGRDAVDRGRALAAVPGTLARRKARSGDRGAGGLCRAHVVAR